MSEYTHIKEMTTREDLNHEAYLDVADVKEPRYPDNEDYMSCYRFWRAIAGEKHFDPYYVDEH